MYQIHLHVPHFNDKILVSVERTLKRFEAHQPFERSSWEMVDDYNLHRRAWLNPFPPLRRHSSAGIADGMANMKEGDKWRESLHPKDYLFRCVFSSQPTLPP